MTPERIESLRETLHAANGFYQEAPHPDPWVFNILHRLMVIADALIEEQAATKEEADHD